MPQNYHAILEVLLLASNQREAEQYARIVANRIKAGYTASYVPIMDAGVGAVEEMSG